MAIERRAGRVRLEVVKEAAWPETAARIIAEGLAEAIAARGEAMLALAGGGTPRPAYRRLAERRVGALDWTKVRLYWSDERCVPATDPASNYAMAEESLLRHLPAPPQIRRIRGELGPDVAAANYDDELRETPGRRRPRFDLVLLGLGEDGHTASLFPGSPALASRKLAVAAISPRPPRDRVTLTPHAINGARRVVFLVTGEAKAAALADTLAAEVGGRRAERPATTIRPAKGEVLWLVDEAAAALLSPPSRDGRQPGAGGWDGRRP